MEPETEQPTRSRADAVADVARRFLVCVFGVGFVGLPLAVSWAVTHTEVVQLIGTSPTTFALTAQGRSEVRLGIAGTVYVPRSQGPFGIVATVDGPGDPGVGDGDLANYVRPEMLELYTAMFHDPGPAIEEYVRLVEDEFRHQLLVASLSLAVGGGSILFALSYLLPVRRAMGAHRQRTKTAGAVVLVVSLTCSVAWVQLDTSGRAVAESGRYDLSVLDGTLADGSTTDSPVILALLGGALSKAKALVARQEDRERDYRDLAEQGLAEQAALMVGPEDGEVAIMMQSDMHCNTTMIRLQTRVYSMLRDQYGASVPALLAITGDLTTNGTAAEGVCIRNEAAIADGGPVAAVTGNHESDVSEQQMDDAGMTVLDGSSEEIGGVRVLGDGDPSRSELFGDTRPRGEETQFDVGERLAAEAADGDRPDVVLVHEAYAAQAFLGIDSVDALMQSEPTSLTRPAADPSDGPAIDRVGDIPASAVFYGHWHRSIEPRVLWNSDGSWTLLMELDTTGGAIDSPTINNFSTPWSQPAQEASFPVIFLNEESRLVAGYQMYSFATDGTVVVAPRVNIGVQ